MWTRAIAEADKHQHVTPQSRVQSSDTSRQTRAEEFKSIYLIKYTG